VEYAGSTRPSGGRRLGSIPSTPTNSGILKIRAILFARKNLNVLTNRNTKQNTNLFEQNPKRNTVQKIAKALGISLAFQLRI